MSSRQLVRGQRALFAFAVIGAVFIMLAVLAGAARAADQSIGDGAIPDLTRTPAVIPPAGGPLETPTPKPTSRPCIACLPESTSQPEFTPTWVDPPTEVWPTGTHTAPPPEPTGQATLPPHGRPPVSVRPVLQFGHSQPGSMILYHQMLTNRTASPVTLGLRAESIGGWLVNVAPEHTTARPGTPLVLTVTVGVPMTPTNLLDIERVLASDGEAGTQAYMITLIGRHPFMDISPAHWADDYVQYMAAEGIVSGYEDGTFRPESNVTRAQFVKMLVGAMHWDAAVPASPTFRDVPAGHWAYSYIETAAAHGVISGYSDGSFRPDDPVLRAQVAKMIVTAQKWENTSTEGSATFSDIPPGNWVFPYAQTASRAGVISGYSDGTFRPYQSASRAQIAKIISVSLFSDPGN